MRDAKNILSEALQERAANNPSYSLRAFARDLGISPQLLSNVINGRRGLSPKLASLVVKKLALTEFERTLFLESIKASFSKSPVQRSISRAQIESLNASSPAKNLEIDLFKTVSNWYHFALLELIKITLPADHSVSEFSMRLGVPELEVMNALARLERLELITRTKKGWKVNQDTVIADHGIASESVRNFHRQLLEKSIQALALQTSEERYGSSSTVPIRVKDVAKAKKMIQEFRLKFDREISDTEEGEEVYGLTFQFFRLTQSTKEKIK